MNLATADLFHAEIARLQAEIERQRSQPCPYVTGNVTRYCTLTPFTISDEERQAVEAVTNYYQKLCDEYAPICEEDENTLATLRGLLERTGCTKNGTAG